MIHKATVVLTAMAAACLLICASWSMVLGPSDWGVVLPFLIWMYIGQLVALAGLICGLVALTRGGAARARWMVAVDTILIAGPWLFLATQW